MIFTRSTVLSKPRLGFCGGACGAVLAVGAVLPCVVSSAASKTNVILCMADDLGWGSVGYNGAKIVKTPSLDTMASEGVRFDRFYAGAPVCSPTRASCLTGRNPYRTGVFTANCGILRPEEITIAEVLEKHGYATGHFGKWHLGTFSKTEKDANRGGDRHPGLYNPPSAHGFDVYFSTESKVPTCDPMRKPAEFKPGESRKFGWSSLGDRPTKPFGTAYWTSRGKVSENDLGGDDSALIMDRALAFIESSVKAGKPFFAVIWFHAPHLPVVGPPKYAAMYKGQDLITMQYAAAITAMDAQMGRLRRELERLGVSKNTMLWFTSDNGPERRTPGSDGSIRAGKLRACKRSLLEGGVRVPGLLVWPDGAKEPMVVDVPVSTCDYFPTILDALGLTLPPDRVLDGVSIMPLLRGERFNRSKPINFVYGTQMASVSGKWKLYLSSPSAALELYDIVSDPGETRNVAAKHPEIVADLESRWEKWFKSCEDSFRGKEYGSSSYDKLRQKWPGLKKRGGGRIGKR